MCYYVRLFATPWTIALQAPLSMELSRQKYWSRLPFPTAGDLPDSGIEPTFFCLLHWQADSSTLWHLGSLARMLGDDKHPGARLASRDLEKVIAYSEQNQKA